MALIGVFDSGVGGLSVLRAIRRRIPDQPVIYVADQGHVPYGLRPVEQVRRFADGIARCLMAQGARVIVVACNTASAAALKELRARYPGVPFVGMEPAVKPASEHTRSGVVGVLATPATFQGALYASVIDRFARGVTVLESTCPGLVEQIEAGRLGGPETRRILTQALEPMLAQNVDTIVLGCTHYPFVIPLIQQIVGPSVQVIDPAPAVARQTERVLETNRLKERGDRSGALKILTSGDPPRLTALLPLLLGEECAVGKVEWRGDELIPNPI